MQTFQLSLTDETVAGLQLSVDEFNVQTGQSLTLEEWIILSLARKAIEGQFGAEADGMKKKHDAELPHILDARHRELIAALGKNGAVRVPPDRTG